MKICVFSDSHGDPSRMIEAVMTEKPDYVFFLGDGERDLQDLGREFPGLPVAAVRGNCDLYSDLPVDLVCAVGGVRIFATHGHRYGVKTDHRLEVLKAAAKRSGAQVALFGHTHSPLLEEEDDLIVINPGPAGRYRCGYAVLEIDRGRVRPRLEAF